MDDEPLSPKPTKRVDCLTEAKTEWQSQADPPTHSSRNWLAWVIYFREREAVKGGEFVPERAGCRLAKLTAGYFLENNESAYRGPPMTP